MGFRIRALALAAVLFAWTPALNAQQILLVDESGTGGAFLDIQLAVDAANDGDFILVQDGTYSGFFVDGKSLSIIAEAGATPVVAGQSQIRNNSSAHHTVLSGLHFRSLGFFAQLALLECSSPILVQDCIVEYEGDIFFTGGRSLQVRNCSAVSLVNTTIDSWTFASSDKLELGVTLSNSNTYAYGCKILAGTGMIADLGGFGLPGNPGYPGPRAVSVEGGFTLLSGCKLRGGFGGDGKATAGGANCKEAGAGGPALALDAGGLMPPAVVLYESRLTKGLGGNGAGDCGPGLPAPTSIHVNEGETTNEQRPRRSIQSTPIASTGGSLNVSFKGEPHDLTWLTYSVSPANLVFSESLAGTIYIGSPFKSVFVGTINSSGEKSANFTVWDTGVDVLPIFLQAFFYDASGSLTLSNPRVTFILNI
jgi:hypothetical protein